MWMNGCSCYVCCMHALSSHTPTFFKSTYSLCSRANRQTRFSTCAQSAFRRALFTLDVQPTNAVLNECSTCVPARLIRAMRTLDVSPAMTTVSSPVPQIVELSKSVACPVRVLNLDIGGVDVGYWCGWDVGYWYGGLDMSHDTFLSHAKYTFPESEHVY
jgi:hypothetical protein